MELCSTRFVLAILVASGVMVIYISRVSLSIAIVAMVKTVKSSTEATSDIPFCRKFEEKTNHNFTNASVIDFNHRVSLDFHKLK